MSLNRLYTLQKKQDNVLFFHPQQLLLLLVVCFRSLPQASVANRSPPDPKWTPSPVLFGLPRSCMNVLFENTAALRLVRRREEERRGASETAKRTILT